MNSLSDTNEEQFRGETSVKGSTGVQISAASTHSKFLPVVAG